MLIREMECAKNILTRIHISIHKRVEVVRASKVDTPLQTRDDRVERRSELCGRVLLTFVNFLPVTFLLPDVLLRQIAMLQVLKGL